MYGKQVPIRRFILMRDFPSIPLLRKGNSIFFSGYPPHINR